MRYFIVPFSYSVALAFVGACSSGPAGTGFVPDASPETGSDTDPETADGGGDAKPATDAGGGDGSTESDATTGTDARPPTQTSGCVKAQRCSDACAAFGGRTCATGCAGFGDNVGLVYLDQARCETKGMTLTELSTCGGVVASSSVYLRCCCE